MTERLARVVGLGRAGVQAALLLAAGCASATPDWREVRLVRDRAAIEGACC